MPSSPRVSFHQHVLDVLQGLGSGRNGPRTDGGVRGACLSEWASGRKHSRLRFDPMCLRGESRFLNVRAAS